MLEVDGIMFFGIAEKLLLCDACLKLMALCSLELLRSYYCVMQCHIPDTQTPQFTAAKI